MKTNTATTPASTAIETAAQRLPNPLQLLAAPAQHSFMPSSPSNPLQLLQKEAAGLSAPNLLQLRTNKAVRHYAQFAARNDVPARQHVFNPEFNGGRPTGLHAYTNGNLPQGVQVLWTYGNTQSVHILVWTHPNARVENQRYCKWSTMFPQPMSEGIVCYNLLQYNNLIAPADRPITGTGWDTVQIGGAGDTIYPLHPASAQIEAKMEAAGLNYLPAAHNTPASIAVNNIRYRLNN